MKCPQYLISASVTLLLITEGVGERLCAVLQTVHLSKVYQIRPVAPEWWEDTQKMKSIDNRGYLKHLPASTFRVRMPK